MINSTFWAGAALGSGASLLLVDTGWLPATFSWRLAFLIGAAIGIVILALRRHVPESPGWLITHAGKQEAEAVVLEIERKATKGHPERLLSPSERSNSLREKQRLSERSGIPWCSAMEAGRYSDSAC